MSECIFCKIVNGELPAAKVYEDDDVLAFLDISQITKGHTLVIPKVHYENIYEMPADLSGKLFSIVPAIANAIHAEFKPEGLNLLNNTGVIAGQSVFHFHLHLIPRFDETDGFDYKYVSHQDQYTAEDLQKISKAIQLQVNK